MREIVLDTETTGLKFTEGDRVIEIGCVEIINRVRSGKYFHCYLKVDKESSAGALKVHGLTKDFLADKPEFSEIVGEFLEFLADDPLVIHNAKFDLGFLNNELELLNKNKLSNQIVDSLIYARKKYPGQQNSLDALCRRYNIDSSKRVKHGALLDAELLADVYIELTGGSQTALELTKEHKIANAPVKKINFPYREYQLSLAEREAHAAMLEKLPDNLWKNN
ncbi:MAG: DNA polymerase III subunit epsilon [Rickettsiales bacterium]